MGTIKKTMIFKEEHLDLINGLARIQRMQIKDVLEELLEKASESIKPDIKQEALNLGKDMKKYKKRIYFK